MRIVANLGVKDECELIEGTIAHLRAIGVDLIVACDMNSTDGTFEILDRYRSDGDFWLFRLDDLKDAEFETWRRASVALIKSSGADWAIFLDADEYWLPASGKLRDCRDLAAHDLLSVDRFNIPLGAHGPAMPERLVPGNYDQLLLLVEPSDDVRLALANDPAMPWVRWAGEPKVMARPDRIGYLALGSHDVLPVDDRPLRRTRPADLLIAHLPFTTRPRFARKLANIRRVFGVHDAFFGELTAWHWRRWLTLADSERLEAEFDSSVFDAAAIATLRRQGVIRSAAEIFGDRAFPAVAGAPC
jgi:glycosyltransferase involved in cell wall biosynthesis